MVLVGAERLCRRQYDLVNRHWRALTNLSVRHDRQADEDRLFSTRKLHWHQSKNWPID